MTFAASHRDGRRRGLAPLEFIMALPFLLFILVAIITVYNIADYKSVNNIRARHRAWQDRHGVQNDKAYHSPKLADSDFGDGLIQKALTADDEIRWLQFGKLLAIGDDPGSTSLDINSVKANKGRIEYVLNDGMPVAPVISRKALGIRSHHAVLGGTWDYRHIPFRNDYRVPLVPHARTGVFVVPSFDTSAISNFGSFAGIASGKLGDGRGLTSDGQSPRTTEAGAHEQAPLNRDQMMRDNNVNGHKQRLEDKLDYYENNFWGKIENGILLGIPKASTKSGLTNLNEGTNSLFQIGGI